LEFRDIHRRKSGFVQALCREKVIFAPKHAELIDGREAKREREAFREQEERERKEEQATQMALPQIKSKTGCNAAVDRTQSNGRKYDDCV
jgi:hypothetical protein